MRCQKGQRVGTHPDLCHPPEKKGEVRQSYPVVLCRPRRRRARSYVVDEEEIVLRFGRD